MRNFIQNYFFSGSGVIVFCHVLALSLGVGAKEKTNLIALNEFSQEEDARLLDTFSEDDEESTVRRPSSLSSQDEDLRSPDALPSASWNQNKSVMLPAGVEEKTYEGVSKAESPSLARKKLIEEATTKISEEAVQSIIGEARFKKNKSIINDKILKQSSRYIPVIKTGDLIKLTEGHKLAVTLQVNSKVLELMLQEQGLLYDNETSPMMIPFVVIEDQISGDSFRWWRSKNSSRMQAMNDYLEKQIQNSFFSSGFFVQKPMASQMQLMIPSAFQQESLAPDQIQSLAKRWNIPITLVGDLSIKKAERSTDTAVIELRLMLTQVSSGRILAQLNRQSKLAKNETVELANLRKQLGFVTQALKDLSLQLQEAWQKGALSSTLVQLEVQGPLGLGKYELFKNSLKATNRSIRQVKERLITGQSVFFELEINGSVQDLVSGFKPVNAGDQIYKFKGVDAANGKLLLAPE